MTRPTPSYPTTAAGAAGLGAARHARMLGLTYQVIEAGSHIGGRAVTVDLASGQPFDLGCHWLQGGSRNPFHATVGAETTLGPLIDRHALWRCGDFVDEALALALDKAFDSLSGLHSEHQQLPLADRFEKQLSIREALSGGHDFEDAYFRMITHECAAEPELVSIYDPAGINFGEGDIPVLSGYGRLIAKAAGPLSVTLNCRVTKVDLSGPDVVVETRVGNLRTSAVILTVSTAVLASEHISFGGSGLPNWKLRAIEGVPTGSSTKVGLQFKKGTMKRLGFERKYLPGAEQLVIVERVDPENGSWHLGTGDGDLCTCYIGGNFSRDLAVAGKASQVAWAKEDLSKLLGDDAMRDVVAEETTPFDTMKTIGGGYSYLRVGYPSARHDLGQPVDERLFFAGEACAGVDATTAHGAWNSGIKAIDQIRGAKSGHRPQEL